MITQNVRLFIHVIEIITDGVRILTRCVDNEAYYNQFK